MAEEFQATAAICGGGGGAWWNSPRSVMSPSDHFLSPCFGAAITSDDFGSQENNLKSRMTCTDHNNIVFGQLEPDSDSGGSTVTMDSTLQMMGLGFTSNSCTDWNQTILQEDLNSNFIRSSQNQDHGQGFLSTTTSPFLLNPACSSSPSTSSSSGLLRNFYEPEPSPYSFVSTTSGPINDLQLSWAKTNPHHQAPYGLINNFSNNANSQPFWSSSPTTNIINNTIPNNFVATPQMRSTRLEEKTKNLKKRSAQSDSLKRAKDNEPATKKPSVTMPSPLPTCKVKKENLRDQITSLQQLVSPFGKTDTASVLQEAIEYIKFLHDQVTVLSTPYMKQGASSQQKDRNENQELRAHGLCLVPLSSTFPVANETTADFWTPTFGGNNFR